MNKKILFVLACTVFFFACKKDSFNTSSNALINFSADTLHFDTVFTGVGSVTQSFKIFNLNNQQLRIDRIELSGGTNSSFKINVNGVSRNSFNNINIAANDSIYVFVTMNAKSAQTNNVLFIRDSVLVNYNGNSDYVQLDAHAQNALFINNLTITHDTTFTNNLPIVILGELKVNPFTTLTINKGARIFCHQNAAIIIDGTLKVNGKKDSASRISFKSDRLDDPYKYYPGSWKGIIFSSNSTNNEINYASIEDAVTAITITGKHNSTPQLQLNSCIINNNLYNGIKSLNSNVIAENCLITNCGSNNLNLNAGNYNFNFCTVVSYSDLLLSHGAPVLALSDTINASTSSLLNASFTNSIFYGDDNAFNDEENFYKTGNNFSVQFDHVLYKTKNAVASYFSNSIQNQDPGFVNIDQQDQIFDFHLSAESVCKDRGKTTLIKTDLDGKARTVGAAPDIGCYEVQ